MIGLTQRQRQVWAALLKQRKSPPQNSLQQMLGFRTRQALDNCLDALAKKGFIEGGRGKPIKILVEDEDDGLTKRALQIREFLVSFTNEHGHAPTRTQMTRAAGLRSRASLKPYLDALAQAGEIEINAGTIRGIRALNNEDVPIIDANVEVPPKGPLLEASRSVERISATVANLFDPRPTLFVRIDNSLLTLGIGGGDLVAVKATSQAGDGELVLVRIGDRLTCREMKRIDEDLVELSPLGTTARMHRCKSKKGPSRWLSKVL